MQRRATFALLALLGPLAGGCGFELRRPPVLPFRRIAFEGFAPRSPLADELRRGLAQGGVSVVEAAPQADVVLTALSDRREKTVVASSAAGQVRELQLRVKFEFRARTPGGRELIAPDELLLKRDLSYTETAALAKELEEAELYREMQSDVVAQVLRRLAAVRL